MDYHKEGEPVFPSFSMPFKPNAARITIISGTKNTRISDITDLKFNARNNFTPPRSLVGTMLDISSEMKDKIANPIPTN